MLLTRIPLVRGDFFTMILLAAFGVILHFAAVMDWKTQTVYRFVWWMGGGLGVVFFLVRLRGHLSAVPELLVSWILFALLQELWFARMYGRADCHAFAVCALWESGMGMGMDGYLLHMILAFAALTLHQALKKNIGPRGTLNQPVAFVPYIVPAFWIVMMMAAFL